VRFGFVIVVRPHDPDNAYLHLYREGMAVDPLDPFGLYVATATGQIFCSLDEGESWQLPSDWLPPVCSIEAAVIG